jgi:ABC-2 type transport system permease protein
MFQYFLSENLKIKNTFLSKLTWVMPILTILLSMLLAATYFQIDNYNWWYTMMLPGLLSLSCALLSRVDGSMKNRGVLSLPIDLKKIWIAKVLVGIKNITLACIVIFVCAQLSPLVVNIQAKGEFPFVNSLVATVLLIITFMWQIPLCMFLGYKIGLFPTALINLVLNIIFTILSVGECWWAIPFTYPARLMCPVLKILPNGLLAEPGSQTFKPELLDTWVIPFGVLVSLILFLAITYLTAKWFKAQEVR